MTKLLRLTTTDNPYDPFDQFPAWYRFDTQHGYNSCTYLARVTTSSHEMPDEMRLTLDEAAIDEIIKYNWTGRYTKAVKEVA